MQIPQARLRVVSLNMYLDPLARCGDVSTSEGASCIPQRHLAWSSPRAPALRASGAMGWGCGCSLSAQPPVGGDSADEFGPGPPLGLVGRKAFFSWLEIAHMLGAGILQYHPVLVVLLVGFAGGRCSRLPIRRTECDGREGRMLCPVLHGDKPLPVSPGHLSAPGVPAHPAPATWEGESSSHLFLSTRVCFKLQNATISVVRHIFPY